MMLSYASYTLQQINSLHQVQMIGVFSKRNLWTLLRREEEKDWRDEEAWRDPTLNIKTIKKS